MKFNASSREISRRVLVGVVLATAAVSSSYSMIAARQVFAPTAIGNGPGGIERRTAYVGRTVYLGAAALGNLPMSYQWYKNGAAIRGASGSASQIAAGAFGGPPTCGASFTIPNAQFSDAGEYAVVFENKYGKTSGGRIVLSVVVPDPAVIISQPPSQRVYAGDAATLKVEAKGTELRYQWEKEGIAIAAATNANYTISKATVSDGGRYTVVVSGGGIEIRSEPATLTVAVPTRPTFSVQPSSQNVAAGSAAVFGATVADATAYQWQRNGVPVPGATWTSLLIYGVTPSSAGTYVLVATNRAGSTVSSEAELTVTPDQTAAGHLANISILALLEAGETLAVGTVLNGAANSGSGAILVRAAGPALSPLGIGGAMRDPTMTLSEAVSGARIASNDDWSGSSVLRSVFQTVGAFPFADNNTKDAAIYQPALPGGSYIVEIKDALSASGRVLAEVYDASGPGVGGVGPRLQNISVRKKVSAESPLVTGFYVGGHCAITVLIRAVGPTLTDQPFGIEGAMPDPALTVFGRDGKVVAANNDWDGDGQVAAAASKLGAFRLARGASKDAVLLATLPPGAYSAQVGPVEGAEGGIVIFEIYELR